MGLTVLLHHKVLSIHSLMEEPKRSRLRYPPAAERLPQNTRPFLPRAPFALQTRAGHIAGVCVKGMGASPSQQHQVGAPDRPVSV